MLLLDEALAGLNPAEIDDAVAVIRRIHATGISIIIVEHLLRVLNQLATRIVVLDRGVLIADGEPDAPCSPTRRSSAPTWGGSVLEVRGVDARYGDAQALWDIALDVGDARDRLHRRARTAPARPRWCRPSRACTAAAAGTITIEGVDIAALPGHRVCDHGVATVPEGRRVFGHMSVRDNLLLGAYRRAGPRRAPARRRRGCTSCSRG